MHVIGKLIGVYERAIYYTCNYAVKNVQVQYYLQLAQQHQQALQATGAGGVQILQQAVPATAGLQTIQLVQAPQATQVNDETTNSNSTTIQIQ